MMYDVVVVGGGPAGLAAGIASRQLGAKVLVVEQGKPLSLRSQINQYDVISGIGGAGLYSDGKFSFYPSATALWSTQPGETLIDGYQWLAEILGSEGLAVPAFPNKRPMPDQTSGSVRRKDYPSFYLPIENRLQILLSLSEKLNDAIRTTCRVRNVEQKSVDRVAIFDDSGNLIAEARQVILALGRLGVSTLQESLTPKELIFRRVELGVRIEQPAEQFILSNDRCLDPKFLGDVGMERTWRTFCCCRNGLVTLTSSMGLSSVSGRADCPPTGRSNVGLLIRFSNPRDGMAAWGQVLRKQPIEEPAIEPISEVIDGAGCPRPGSRVAKTLGILTAWPLARGLKDLTDFAGRPATDALIYAPAIEGVGLYPAAGPDLKIPGRPVFVAGDIAGTFRGLTAALISGFVAGSAAARAALAETF